MSFLSHIDSLRESDKSHVVKKLIKDSTPDFDFFLLITLSVLMATFGMLINSAAVVIGSMLIAPILYPILGLSLGMVISDYKLIARSFYTIVKASVIGVIAATVATAFFSSSELTSEILSRTEPSLMYFLIAVIAGFAGSYTMFDPDLNVTIPGIAIAVALIPHLVLLALVLLILIGQW